MENMGMKVLLIRHGKTKGNLERRYVGRTDEPLLESSREELSASAYTRFEPELIYCSRMLRCRQTAQILFPGREVRLQDGLEETDFGQFEYHNYEELSGDPAYQSWLDGGGLGAFPGGESGVEFRQRCCRAFDACMRDAQRKQAERIAIIAHGGTIMSIMERYGEPRADFYSYQVKNGGGFLTEVYGNEEEKDGIWKIFIRSR